MKDSLDSDIDLSGQQDSKQENHAKMDISNPETETLSMTNLPMTNQPIMVTDISQLLVRTILLILVWKTLGCVCVKS